MARLPEMIKPQLAVLVEAPPPGLDYLYEIKYDGYRMVCRVDRSGVHFFSREGKDWTPKLGALAKGMAALKLGTGWLDGEIVVFEPKGTSSFQRLQNAMDRNIASQVRFVAFDVPFWAGKDLRELPLVQRLEFLDELLDGLPTGAPIVRSTVLDIANEGDGHTVWAKACELGLEGLIGKRRDAPYHAGRSTAWIKLKCRPRQEFVVGGWTTPRGKRKGFGALLVGLREGKKLRFVGRVGSGYSDKTIDMLLAKLQPLATDEMPFTAIPSSTNRWSSGAEKVAMHWVKPQMVVEVAYTTITDDGILRQPSFQGVREDKPARKVTGERKARLT